MRLARNVASIEIGDVAALFVEERQHILRLEGLARRFCELLEKPQDLGALIAELGPAAWGTLHTLLPPLAAQGILACDAGPGVFDSKVLDIGERKIAIGFGSADPQERWSLPYAHLPGADRSAPVEAWIDRVGDLVFVQAGESLSILEPDEHHRAPLILRRGLLDLILNASGGIAVHAACLQGASGAILLSGPPASGKSTLARAMAERGFPILGDDVAWFDMHTGRIMPIPLPLTVKNGRASDEAAAAEGEWIEREDGWRIYYRPLASAPETGWQAIEAVVAIDRSAGGPATCEPGSPVETLRHLYDGAHSASGKSTIDEVRALAQAAANAAGLTLRYREAEDGAAILAGQFDR